jgi:hypothetical protein
VRADRRLPAALLVSGLSLALAVLAWPWLYSNVVAPLALVIWLMLRVLVLGIDQRLLWLALVCAVPALLFAAVRGRILRGGERADDPVACIHPLESWEHLVGRAVATGARDQRSFGSWDGFVELAVRLEALMRRVPADSDALEALRAGGSSLPPRVRAFLFPRPASLDARWLGRAARSVAQVPRRVLRRLSGRDRSERLLQISELLTFLEHSLELPSHDHRGGTHP